MSARTVREAVGLRWELAVLDRVALDCAPESTLGARVIAICAQADALAALCPDFDDAIRRQAALQCRELGRRGVGVAAPGPIAAVQMPRRHDGRPPPNAVRYACGCGHLHPSWAHASRCKARRAAREAAAK